MRDPATIYTRRGTPLILIISRGAFVAYFGFLLWLLIRNNFAFSDDFTIHWLVYIIAMYGLAEYTHRIFLRRGIDLTFAFPLLLAVYILHLVSLLLSGQEDFPLLNRAEHFTSFILVAYIVWVFFLDYLPQRVWERHPYYTAIIVLAITSLAGVFNEIIELFMATSFGVSVIGSGYDTSMDLLMNTLGAGLLLAVQLILGEAYGRFDKEK